MTNFEKKSKLRLLFLSFGFLFFFSALLFSYSTDSARSQDQDLAFDALQLRENLQGKITLRVESDGEAHYINPDDLSLHSLGRPADAFQIMRNQGLGISNQDIAKIQPSLDYLSGKDTDGDGLPDDFERAIGTDPYNQDTSGNGYSDWDELKHGYDPLKKEGRLLLDEEFSKSQAGKILLQVEQNGEAWYVNPENNKRYFLGRPADAFEIMRNLGLGISEEDFERLNKQEEDWFCGEYFLDERDGKKYSTVKIGSQCWLAENLNIGEKINSNENQGAECESIEKYCYDNNSEHCDIYGGIYQWEQAMCGSVEERAKGICPEGWHIPSDDDFNELEMTLGMDLSDPEKREAKTWRGKNEGSALAGNHNIWSDVPSTLFLADVELKLDERFGESGFDALPAGIFNHNRNFVSIEKGASWWTSSKDGEEAIYRSLRVDYTNIGRFSQDYSRGYSVRCVKDIDDSDVNRIEKINKENRDLRRLSQVRQTQTALEMYYVEHASYPESLEEILDYISFIPSNPTSAYGSPCSPDQEYDYTQKDNGDSYVLEFCLEIGPEESDFGFGMHCAGPDGIVSCD